MAKVYVSSTIVDLEERQAVIDWLVAAQHQVVHSYRPNSHTVRDSVAAGAGRRRIVVGEIPQEPQAFQDRAELLEALTGPGAGGGVKVVFAVTGLRGVGKSQLAAACARRRLAEGWPVVAWLDASGPEQLLAGYAQLAAELGLADDGPDSAAAACGIGWRPAGSGA